MVNEVTISDTAVAVRFTLVNRLPWKPKTEESSRYELCPQRATLSTLQAEMFFGVD
jgi:hypothetical protein